MDEVSSIPRGPAGAGGTFFVRSSSSAVAVAVAVAIAIAVAAALRHRRRVGSGSSHISLEHRLEQLRQLVEIDFSIRQCASSFRYPGRSPQDRLLPPLLFEVG
jgi:hypothetical protein